MFVLLPGGVATAQDAEGTTRVIEQARFWEQRGRYDLANDAWNKVLVAEPANPEALTALGVNAAGAGNNAAASGYLQRLQAEHPGHPGIQRIQSALTTEKRDDSKLQAARQYARDKQYGKAVVAYREFFDGEQPQGRLALEYYQTLGGTREGWSEARDGLRRLVADNPNNSQFALALAEHLTYREQSRREGIKRLAELEQNAAVAAPARAARRQALVWLDAKQSDVPLYRAYLADHPNDSAVTQRLERIQQDVQLAKQARRDRLAAQQQARQRQAEPQRPQEPPPLAVEDELVKFGFEALNNNELNLAESRFREALQRAPDNASALGGLGVIRLRTEHFGEAESLLERAQKADPKNGDRWDEALASARFWSRVRQADAARDAGELERAASIYRESLQRMPEENSVRSTYADVLREMGRHEQALSQYRRVLKNESGNTNAQRGIVDVLVSQGRTDEALAFAEGIPADQRKQLPSLSNVKAQRLRDQADRAKQQGDTAQAEALLRQALALNPESPWIRLDLARIYREQGQTDKAESLIDGLLASEGIMPDAVYIKALLLAQKQRWWDGLQLLERIPRNQRTQAMHDLQRRLWIRYQTERAVAFAREGQQQAARQILAQVDQQVVNDPEALGALAQAYAESGNQQRALRLMREAITGAANPSPGMRLQYAGLLFTLNQTVEFEIQMERLRNTAGQLTSEQREGLNQLESGYALRQADRLREQGKLADAYEVLRPHLQSNPRDPSLLTALARLYDDFGEPKKSLDLYYDVLEIEPDDLNAMDGAIRAAIDTQRYNEADYLIDQALAQAPANPRFYVLAGRLARSQGNNDQAVALFKQALALDSENSAAGLGGGGERVASREPIYLLGTEERAASNPFGQPRQQRYEDQYRPYGPRLPAQQQSSEGFYYRRSALPEERKPVLRYSSVPQVQEQEYRPAPRAGVGNQEYTPAARPGVSQSPAPSRSQPSQPRRDSTQLREFRPVEPRQPVKRRQLEDRVYRFSTPQDQRSRPIQRRESADPQRRRGVYSRTPLRSAARPVIRYESSTAPIRPIRMAQRRRDGSIRAVGRRRSAQRDPRGQLIEEIADIEAGQSNWAAGGFNLRVRDGQDGLGELTNIEVPIEGSIGEAGPGRLRARAVPVFLDAGTPSGTNAEFFGALPIAEAENGAGSAASIVDSGDYDQSESGVAVGVIYELTDFRFDIGSTPLGFPEENLVGGLLWTPRWDNILLSLDVSRRAVTDSLLSYAGTQDPFLNGLAGDEITFGGVTKNGARVDIANDQGSFGIYGNVGYHILEGEQVEDNSVFEIGGGFYQHVWDRSDSKFTAGLNLTSFFYDENLSRFTLGHGGYFSPQFYVSLGMPLELIGRKPRLAYRVGGSLGLQAFDADATPIFPGNFGGAQSRLAAAPGNPDLNYEGEDNLGLGFNVYGDMEYLLTPHLSLGGRTSFDNAKDFEQFSVSAYLRYWFRPQRPRIQMPRILAPFFAGEPSW